MRIAYAEVGDQLPRGLYLQDFGDLARVEDRHPAHAEPGVIGAVLDVPDEWSLIAYLCLGYPQEEHLDPELQRAGWQDRLDVTDFVLQR